MAQKNVVIVGAGVAGLTTALLLSKDPIYKIVVTAKHMPGDYDIEYASPWAGANYMPVSYTGTDSAEWDKNTWGPLEELARNHPDAGIHFQECQILNRAKDSQSATAAWFAELLSPNPWFKDVVPKFHPLPKSELGPEIDHGVSFMSVCINTAIYLPWLVSQCLKRGVIFKRAFFNHILDATNPGVHPLDKVHVVVNCTGLMASKIGGVEDEAVVPARGQIVVVRNDAGRMLSISGTDDGDDEACYVMTRAAGGGTILGGCYQKGSWDGNVDPTLAIRIMKRAVKLCPELTDGKGIEHLDIVRHGVGLRPVREGGTRIEKERIGGVTVVHNYGSGGAGYQNSYGCSLAAVKLIEEAVASQSRL
ncbi:hypothetical protein N7481_001501 [Penicillium waksmanii]|uniref:uncharacterized protein n=1 Tax=Penicillium waksmanii TaxID=69791 RepID=UPI002546E40D|nr:uncharacterized protein N7481_001501 [Penicillium waksmanii]KAJ6001092.1 hypothetical protein N7481_001501 [Penicillium waksmanii]